MGRPKIVFLCHVSNPDIRGELDLYQYSFRRFVYGLSGGKTLYEDFAIWVSDYINEFEKHPEFEFHIVAPHWGMKKEFQSFNKNGIFYHFFKCNNGFFYTVADKFLHMEERNQNVVNRRRIKSIISSIMPDIVVLCGAENAYYATGVLDVRRIPVYVILQTLLNDPKRIEMGLGTQYKRQMELEIFKHARYFCTPSENAFVWKIKEVNPDAIILPVRFPSHRPVVTMPSQKEYDFTFFSMHIGKNKGIEDVLRALSIIKATKGDVSLNIIGKSGEYKKRLDEIINNLGLVNNVRFAGFFQQLSDTFENVVKARAVVVPGITALNSTVRESMLMGMPTICYETPLVKEMNSERTCVIAAPMEDIEKLAEKMWFVLRHPEEALTIAENGKRYAEKEFSNEAIVNKLLGNCQLIIEKKV